MLGNHSVVALGDKASVAGSLNGAAVHTDGVDGSN